MAELPVRETLPQLVRRALATPRAFVFAQRDGDAWAKISTGELLNRVERLARAIRGAGIAPGDRVALVAHDCIDWIVTDFAVLFAGCVVVPIFPTQALDQTAYILEHSQSRLIFVDGAATRERLRSGARPLPPTIAFDDPGEHGLQAFEASGAAAPSVREAENALRPDDLAVLIYTSGTTGNPKGVMLSHDNITFDAVGALTLGLDDLTPGNDVLSVLPFAHIYEHTILYIYLLAQVRCYVCRDPSELVRDVRAVRPVVMTAVPRIFDRVLAGIVSTARAAGGLQARLVPWALAVGRANAAALQRGQRPPLRLRLAYWVARRLVLEKIRARLGLDRLRYFVSGSAALHYDTAMTFLGLGLPIMQGYGLTETSPVVTASRPSVNEYGAAGKPLAGVEVRIANDGEILTRGRHVMQGYFRDPAATANVIVDGWLHTGDVGTLDGAGFLHVTDRKGEVFKTDGGKWIAPARVEAAVKRSVYAAQVMVVGSGRPHPIALVCPNWELVRSELELPEGATAEELAVRDDVRRFFDALVGRQTRELATFEQVRSAIVVAHEFSVESGELSPAMKVKRRVVERRYAHDIERAYAGMVA